MASKKRFYGKQFTARTGVDLGESVRRKPSWCYMNCPLSQSTNGFAVPDSYEKLLSGQHRLMFLLEAAGKTEAEKSLPLCGATGERVWRELSPPDLDRSKVLIDNTLRCNPQDNLYPVGLLKEKAERACRHWDLLIHDFNPTHLGVTFHPASLRTAPNTTVFVKRDIARAWELSKDPSNRVLLLMGVRALSAFMPDIVETTMKKWHGSFWKVSLKKHPDREDLEKAFLDLEKWKLGQDDSPDFYTPDGLYRIL